MAGQSTNDTDGQSATAIAVAGLVLIPLMVSALSGNLGAGPVLVDDNQIFLLDRNIGESGLWAVSTRHMEQRLFEMGRVVPVYLVQKLALVAWLGTDVTLWDLYNVFMGGLTACVLFAAGRLIGLRVIEAFAFALIVVLGEQSVLWWRHLHGEGIGMLLASLAVLCIPLETRYAQRAGLIRTAFVILAVLAALSKESFIVLLPALVFARMCWDRHTFGLSWFGSLRKNAVPMVVLAAVCLGLVFFIATALERTHFGYTGWRGFDAGQFAAIAGEFFGGARGWFLVLAIVAEGLYWRWTFGDERMRRRGIQDSLAALVLVGAVLVPQFLLYMSSGFSGDIAADPSRFLVPSTLGLAMLTLLPVARTRRRLAEASPGGRGVFVWVTAALLVAMLTLQYRTALASGRESAAEREDIGIYLTEVAGHTDADDQIVYVCGIHNLHDAIYRMAVMLREYKGLDAKNMHFLPILGVEPPESYYLRLKNKDEAYVAWMNERLIEHWSDLESVDTVVIATDQFLGVERPFLLESSEWFDPEGYVRFANNRGDVAYFKPEPLPHQLSGYKEQLSWGSGTADIVDGALRVTGKAQVHRYVDRVSIRVGDVELEPRVELSRRSVDFPYQSYEGEELTYTLEAEWPTGLVREDAVLVLYSGESVLLEAPLTWSDRD